jgi:hypothetical protein
MLTRPVLPRGIWTLNFFDSAGAEIVVAIASDARCIGWMPFKPHTYDESHAIQEHILDTFDPPRPMLEVVR